MSTYFYKIIIRDKNGGMSRLEPNDYLRATTWRDLLGPNIYMYIIYPCEQWTFSRSHITLSWTYTLDVKANETGINLKPHHGVMIKDYLIR